MAYQMSPDANHKPALDSTQHQTAYVFAPTAGQDHEEGRHSKRRKVSKPSIKATAKDVTEDGSTLYFPTLFNGVESAECVSLRQRIYEEAWARADQRIQSILGDANEKTLSEVTKFLDQGVAETDKEKIPTALIVTGPNIASQELLFTQLADRIRSETHALVVTFRSGDATNLKTVLKKLIRDATNQDYDDEDDRLTGEAPAGQKLLNYDLQILRNHLKSSENRQVVVAFQDSEAFDSVLLTELILLFKSWITRIPFVTLFGIATSLELFHERFPHSATLCLQGAQFDVEQTSKTLGKIFQSIIAGSNVRLRLGASFVTALLERQHDHVQSLQTFIASLKYAYMTHFYANPLSIFLANPKDLESIVKPLIQPEHIEALRMLPSFKKRIELLVEAGKTEEARRWMDSDEDLLEFVFKQLQSKEEFMDESLAALNVLNASLASIISHPTDDPTEIYIKFFAGTLNTSEIIQGLIAACKRVSSTEALDLLNAMRSALTKTNYGGHPTLSSGAEEFSAALIDFEREITSLIEEAEKSGKPLRSRYNMQAQTLRTTVVAQKVQLSKREAVLSSQDAAFTKTIDALTETLENYFTFGSPMDIFAHEIWLYDSRSPYQEVFTPRPRYAIERALSAPHDYLGCSCCRASSGGLSSTQPPTAILYQLYLETGALINVFDLWSAFYTIVGGEEGEEKDERAALVLFYRALADLRLLGCVKLSRKKTDHLGKLAWKGL